MTRLQGKRALVTGGTGGIGIETARQFLAEGAQVAVTGSSFKSIEAARALLGPDVLYIQSDAGDIADQTHVADAVKKVFGGLDILFVNAGFGDFGPIESFDEARFDRSFAVNVKGPWLGIKSALTALTKARGVIVNIGSTRATRPLPGLFPYVASKAGLWGLTRQVAVELLEDGITCNMVAPGWVDTPGERAIQARQGRPDFPAGLRNLATPEEIGAAVAFLASPAGRRITGDILYLDSGLHIADDVGMVHLPGAKARIAWTPDAPIEDPRP